MADLSGHIKGGDKLAKRLAEMAAKITNVGTLGVGFLENAKYPDGKSVAMIAAIQDFGAPSVGIPPRPFFRNMIAAKSPAWGTSLGTILKNNDYDARKSLMIMGELIKGQLKQSIIDTNSPPLSPVTIARKGFAKPLIHTKVMINSVDYEVK